MIDAPMQLTRATARIGGERGVTPPPAVALCFSCWWWARRGLQATSWLKVSCPIMASSRWSSRSFRVRDSFRLDLGRILDGAGGICRRWRWAATAMRSHEPSAPTHSQSDIPTTRARPS